MEHEHHVETKQDQYFECLTHCVESEQEESCTDVCTPALTHDPEGPTVKIPNHKMTADEDKFHYLDEGELISELLQITAELGGEMTRQTTLNSKGESTKRIVIEYNHTNK